MQNCQNIILIYRISTGRKHWGKWENQWDSKETWSFHEEKGIRAQKLIKINLMRLWSYLNKPHNGEKWEIVAMEVSSFSFFYYDFVFSMTGCISAPTWHLFPVMFKPEAILLRNKAWHGKKERKAKKEEKQ